MSPMSPRVMPSKDSKVAEDFGALLMRSRTIIFEFGIDTYSIAEASATAIEPPMHVRREGWQLNCIDHEKIEPILPSSLSRKRKAQQLAEDVNQNSSRCTRSQLQHPKKAPTSKAACPANTHAARGDLLLPKTIYHNGKD